MQLTVTKVSGDVGTWMNKSSWTSNNLIQVQSDAPTNIIISSLSMPNSAASVSLMEAPYPLQQQLGNFVFTLSPGGVSFLSSSSNGITLKFGGGISTWVFALFMNTPANLADFTNCVLTPIAGGGFKAAYSNSDGTSGSLTIQLEVVTE